MAKYKLGDIVKIKSWESMERDFGTDYDGDIKLDPYFTTGMRKFCGGKAKITEVIGDKEYHLSAIFSDGFITEDSVAKEVKGYSFCDEMFEDLSEVENEEENKISDEFNRKFSELEIVPLESKTKDRLIREMDNLLDEYDYHQTKMGLTEIVNEWYDNKAKIIALLAKHPNYNGNFQIVFDAEYHRVTDKDVVLEVLRWFKGETFDAYYRTDDREEKTKWDRLNGLFNYLEGEIKTLSQTITAEIAETINNYYADAHAREGQKLSKVIGKIARESGLDKVDGYTTQYPRLGDAINPLTFKRKTVVSVNPIDYYTMSFGDTWQSCHTIDKTNKRRNNGTGYQGCYSSGTESYMLDESSIVFYTIDESLGQNKGKSLERCDKNQRCMFHLGEDKLIQGRVYPQGTDGAASVYKEIRTIMQKVIADCFSVPNYWDNKKGTDECDKVISSTGTNYEDYFNFEDCNVSYLKNEFQPNRKYIRIGHYPICPCCGEEHEEQETIECRDCWEDSVECAGCGCSEPRDEMYEIDGEWYCSDCSFYCSYHEEREVGTPVYVSEYGSVCEDALDTGDFVYCDWCEDWHERDGSTVIAEDGSVFCSSACARGAGYRRGKNGQWYEIGELIFCSECGEYVLNEDWDEEHGCCKDCAKELEDEVSEVPSETPDEDEIGETA